MADETPTASPTGNDGIKTEDGQSSNEPPTPESKEVSTPKAQDKGQDSVQERCISPSPSGEELPQEDLDNIIKSTLEMLEFSKTKVDEQKSSGHSLAFMLLRIRESLDAYHKDYIPQLNTFLVNADRISADYYARMCCSLPRYGAYVGAIAAETSERVEAGGNKQVSKSRLLSLVNQVVDNYFAEAMMLKSSRAMLKDINGNMNERRYLVCQVITQMPNWMDIQDSITCQLERIRDQIFKISAYLNFLKALESPAQATTEKEKPVKPVETVKDDTPKNKKDETKPAVPVDKPKIEEPVKPTTGPKTEEPLEPATEPKTEEPVTPTTEPKTEDAVTPATEPKTEEPVTPTTEPKTQPKTEEPIEPATEHRAEAPLKTSIKSNTEEPKKSTSVEKSGKGWQPTNEDEPENVSDDESDDEVYIFNPSRGRIRNLKKAG